MSKVTRVTSYKRVGESGRVETVSSHVRKVLDAVEGLQAKRGANTTVSGVLQQTPSPSLKPKRSPQESARRLDVDWVVQATMRKASDVEPDVTNTLGRVATRSGGRLVGLDHRLKTEESLTRKVTDGSSRNGESPQDFAEAHVVDALRYTLVSDDESNLAMARRTVDQLRSEGHSVSEDDIYNYWGEDSIYHGINIAVTAPNGLRWEVQIHTESSLVRKRHSHFWYEIMRDSSNSVEDVEHAREQSRNAWMGLRRPPGWSSFGSMQAGGRGQEYVGGEPGDIPSSAVAPHLSVKRGADEESELSLSYLYVD